VWPVPEYVFGYGSLTALAPARPARLRGHRRVWGVAMDNSLDIPGYKRYERPDGSRPRVYVAFLDVVEEPGAEVTGALVPVDSAALDALDARERSYTRVDVTGQVERPGGRVWTYAGSPAGRERFRRARDGGTVVVSGEYLLRVQEAFAALAIGDPPGPDGLPVVELRRIDLPPA
jgi:gamma-glutamylcyclotransferase (GGCT)/AIG2-like uncharacterized protein YtfP